jgi:hypothetical protein
MKKILDIIKKLFGNKELIGTAVQVIVEPKEVTHKKKPKKKKKNESR